MMVEGGVCGRLVCLGQGNGVELLRKVQVTRRMPSDQTNNATVSKYNSFHIRAVSKVLFIADIGGLAVG